GAQGDFLGRGGRHVQRGKETHDQRGTHLSSLYDRWKGCRRNRLLNIIAAAATVVNCAAAGRTRERIFRMAERPVKSEVAKLRLGAGEEFRGEGILAVTKALLQSGVSYVSGYQGAPISHLVYVLADAKDVLDDLGIRFEASANEAAAAAALAASINYSLR